MDVMQRKIVIGVVVLFVGAAIYYSWNIYRQTPPPPVAIAQAQVPTPITEPVPVKNYPIEPPVTSAPAPLPTLDLSDKDVGDALARAFGRKSLPTIFYPGKMIRRFVATVDNLPRQHAPARMWPVRPVGGSFMVSGMDSGLVIDSDNSARYSPYIKVMQALDVVALVDLYVRFYPLFQQAYQELGYPKGYFNNRLIETLDNLLDAPEVSAPMGLTHSKVLYEYADPTLETRSAGQKVMVRMGSSNSARAKTTLRAIRSEVLRRVSGK